jgi:exopolyphosphatase/guanosine-5'-triphosphate,3'-diphosphate pyrophosphatase
MALQDINMTHHWLPFTPNRSFQKDPRVFVAADGMHFTTHDGRQVLDGISSLWCVGAGHNRKPINEAIKKQLDTLDYATAFQASNDQAFKAAEIAALAVLDEAHILFNRQHWDKCYGSSGTVGAVSDILTQAGWPEGRVTRDGLSWLKERLLKAQKLDNLRLEGVKEDRKPVIGGGLAVLQAVFDLLQIDEMDAAQGALRHGALYDLIDRESPQDVRSSMVSWLAQRFGTDAQQADRVSRTAQGLLEAMIGSGTDQPQNERQRHLQKLHWACQLHETGMRISHSDYHKHGAYILDNTDLPGFTLDELHRLSQLVLGHRGKLRKLEAELQSTRFVQQLMALRLAVILCHARRDPDLSGLHIQCDVERRTASLQMDSDWAELWPQSAHLLREEKNAWQKTDWVLQVSAG